MYAHDSHDRKSSRVVDSPAFYLEDFGADVNTWYFNRIKQTVRVNAGIVPEIRRRPPPSVSFPIYDSLILPSVVALR